MPQDWNEPSDEKVEPMKLKLLGTDVGTHDSWDDSEPGTFIVNDFIPYDAFKGLIDPGTFLVEYNEGELRYYDDEGKVVKAIKILDLFPPKAMGSSLGISGTEDGNRG